METYKHMEKEYPEAHKKLTLKEYRARSIDHDKKMSKELTEGPEDIEI